MKARRTRSALIPIIGLLLSSTLGSSVAASDLGPYLGGAVGRGTVALRADAPDWDDLDFEGDDIAYKLFVGFRALPFLAVEGSYRNFGNANRGVDGLDLNAKLTGYDIAALGLLPLGPVEVFGRAGYAWWDLGLAIGDGLGDTRLSLSGGDLTLGAGVAVRFGSWAVRGEYEVFDLEGARDVYMVSVGAAVTF